jgi:hypothetical protein
MLLSNFRGSRSRVDAKDYILKTDKPLKYTHGLGFRGPTTHNKPIDKEEAIRIIDKGDFLDITEYDNYIHLNTYSDNDMW